MTQISKFAAFTLFVKWYFLFFLSFSKNQIDSTEFKWVRKENELKQNWILFNCETDESG